MSLKSFKKMPATRDDVELHYHGSSNEQLVYHAATTDVEEIVNAKIFPDGKSIAEAQAEIEL